MSMEDKKIRVAITQGDTNGIGYELIFKTFADPGMLELCTPIIYGSPKIATYHRNALDMQASFTIIGKAEDAREGKVNVLTTFDEDVKVELGHPAKEAGAAAMKALNKALADSKTGCYDALVTLPMNKQSMEEGFKGQTKHIEDTFADGKKPLTIFANDTMRVALATTHMAVKDIAPAISKEFVEERIKAFHTSLKRDFRLSNPRIAVLALNPQTIDGNSAGAEETDVIAPAIKTLEGQKIQAFGPYAADEFFGNGSYELFDGVLAMYDDQGIAPFRTLDLGDGYCFTAGLPVVRTSPATMPAFDTAGKGTADESSFRHAIYAAIDIARNRCMFDEAIKNPLPKLYHEKRDDSEKVRFAIPKKHENKQDGKTEVKQESKQEGKTDAAAEDKQ